MLDGERQAVMNGRKNGKQPVKVPFQWDNKVGMAAIGSLSILIAGGVAWGSIRTQTDALLNAVANIKRESSSRDAHMQSQETRLSKVETSVQFIVPAIQRIEAKLDNKR